MPPDLNKDDLLNEISRRVIQLDAQRELDDELKKTVWAYIEALDEVTGMDKAAIESIAHQVINEYKLSPQPTFKISGKIFLVAGLSLGLILLLAIQAGKYLGLRESLTPPVANDSQVNYRADIIRNKLAQVITVTSPLKVAAVENYMTTLKFPKDFAEIGFTASDYEDGELVKKVNFTAEGGIMIELGDGFDPNTKLLLQSDAFENKDIVRWVCKTSIPQKYLGAAKAASCTYSENL